jgi:hypothetical protein
MGRPLLFSQELHNQIAKAAKEQHTASGQKDCKTEKKACPQMHAAVVIPQFLCHAAEGISLRFSLGPEHRTIPPLWAADFLQSSKRFRTEVSLRRRVSSWSTIPAPTIREEGRRAGVWTKIESRKPPTRFSKGEILVERGQRIIFISHVSHTVKTRTFGFRKMK